MTKGFNSIPGISDPASLVSGTLLKMRQNNDNSEIEVVIQKGEDSDKTVKLTLKQREVIKALQLEGGVLGARECSALDHRVLKYLFRFGIIEHFDDGIALTDTASTFLEDSSEEGVPFRDRCQKLFETSRWQSKFAKALGVSRQTVVKWASGRLEVPEYVMSVLECLEALKENQLPFPKRFSWK